MSRRGGTARVAGTTILAIAAAVLLLPISALGQHNHPGIAAKSGALNRHARAATIAAVHGATSVAGSFASVRTISLGTNALTNRPANLLAPLVTTSPRILSKFVGQAQNGYLPPDTQMAATGTYVFELTNEQGKITNTAGTHTYATFTTQGFFAINSTDNVGDVQLMWDGLSARWFFSACDFTVNKVWIAVSLNASPIGSYYTYWFNTGIGLGPTLMDQPTMGVSRTFAAWDVNIFNSTSLSFLGTNLMVFNKHKLEIGSLSYQALSYNMFSLHPARQTTTNGTGTDVLYAASTVSLTSSTSVDLLEISGTVGSLTTVLLSYSISSTGTVPGGVQAGTTTLVVTGDDRVQSIGWANGYLWLAYSVACTPSGDATTRSCVRADAVQTATNAVKQDSNIGLAGLYLFYPALVPFYSAGTGFLMILGYSGALDYPSIAVTGQNSTDNYGTYRGPIPVLSGANPDTSGRFGDYSGISYALSGTRVTAWGASEYDGSSGWATEVVHFSFY